MKIEYSAHYWHADKSAKALFEPIAFKPPTKQVTASFTFIFDKTRQKLVLTKLRRGWGVPGGHREKGETPEQCAIREAYEETSIHIKNLHVIGRRRVDNRRKNDLKRKYPYKSYLLFFIAEINGVDDFDNSFETSERAIVDIDKLGEYISNEKSFFNEVFKYIKDKIDLLDNQVSSILEPDRVSIIIPIYNTAKYLDACLDSILAQDYNNLQIILVNDKSTDRSLNICHKYQKKDERIVIIENNHNVGLAKSRNAGIRKIDGKYLMFIDSDDFIAYGSIQKLVKTAQKTNSDIVEYAFSEVSEQIEYNNTRFISKLTTHSSDEVLENLFTHRKPGFARIEVWNKFYKSDLFKKVRFPDARYAEDLAIIVDIYLDAKKITFLPERLYFYRKRPDSLTESKMTQEKLNNEALSLAEVRKAIKQRRPKLLGMANDFIINLGELSLGKLQNDSATINATKLLEVLKDE